MNGAASSVLAIGAGAAIGAVLRWLLAVRFNPLWSAMPLGTLAANLVGGYAIGLVLGWLGQHPELSPQLRSGLRLFPAAQLESPPGSRFISPSR